MFFLLVYIFLVMKTKSLRLRLNKCIQKKTACSNNTLFSLTALNDILDMKIQQGMQKKPKFV